MLKPKLTVITEGKSSEEILRSILRIIAPNAESVFYTRDGFSSVLSTASSLVGQPDSKILMVVDADSSELNKKKEREDFVRLFVGKDTNDFKLIVLSPEIEILFFGDKASLQEALNKEISPEVWALAQANPKKALQVLSGNTSQLLNNNAMIRSILNMPAVKDLSNFAQSA
jgi:hypothetical protein